MTKQERRWASIEKKRDNAWKRKCKAADYRDRVSEEEFYYLTDSIGLSKLACVTGYCSGGEFDIYIEMGGRLWRNYGELTIQEVEFIIDEHKDLPWFLDYCAYRNLPCGIGSKDIIRKFTPRMYLEARRELYYTAGFVDDNKSEYEWLCDRIKQVEEERKHKAWFQLEQQERNTIYR